jgi:hypothetical protein
VQPVSVKANVSAANVKRGTRGRNQNRLHAQKALLEYLVCGHVNPQE